MALETKAKYSTDMEIEALTSPNHGKVVGYRAIPHRALTELDFNAWGYAIGDGSWFFRSEDRVRKAKAFHEAEYEKYRLTLAEAPDLNEDIGERLAKYMPLSDLLRLARTSNANYDALTSNCVIIGYLRRLGRQMARSPDRERILALKQHTSYYDIDYLDMVRRVASMYVRPVVSRAVVLGSLFYRPSDGHIVHYIVVGFKKERRGGRTIQLRLTVRKSNGHCALTLKTGNDIISVIRAKVDGMIQYLDGTGVAYTKL